MSSILLTPPAVEPVSLTAAKGHLRVAHADDDGMIGTLIIAGRRLIEAQTGLSLISQQWQCFLDDWPEGSVIELPVAPLIDVDELATYDDDDIKSVIDPAHYYVDAAARPPRLLLRGSRAWTSPGRIGNGVAVTVTVGFGPDEGDVPEPLRQAVLTMVAHWYEHRGNASPPPPPITLTALLAPYRERRL